jgi:hypothetical protein
MSATTLPTAEQEQRAKWDLLLRDLELRAEQIHQMKAFEGWRLLFQGMTASAALLGAGAAIGALLVKAFGG